MCVCVCKNEILVWILAIIIRLCALFWHSASWESKYAGRTGYFQLGEHIIIHKISNMFPILKKNVVKNKNGLFFIIIAEIA